MHIIMCLGDNTLDSLNIYNYNTTVDPPAGVAVPLLAEKETVIALSSGPLVTAAHISTLA